MTAPAPQPLPCPFCGRAPERAHRPSTVNKSGESHFIGCFCGGNVATARFHGETADEVLTRWNTRHVPALPTDRPRPS